LYDDLAVEMVAGGQNRLRHSQYHFPRRRTGIPFVTTDKIANKIGVTRRAVEKRKSD